MSVSVTQYKNFVGGEWVEATTGETMDVLNPATGEVIAEVPRGGEEDGGAGSLARQVGEGGFDFAAIQLDERGVASLSVDGTSALRLRSLYFSAPPPSCGSRGRLP